jgi:hypothetical protein
MRAPLATLRKLAQGGIGSNTTSAPRVVQTAKINISNWNRDIEWAIELDGICYQRKSTEEGT